MLMKEACLKLMNVCCVCSLQSTPDIPNTDISKYPLISKKVVGSRGRTYVMITYVSKENNFGPDDKIRYIWGLKGLIFIS